ncbi:MAG TPA: choice-of-anchor J domain-containing protein, partial [Chitinophagaceae bacterium]
RPGLLTTNGATAPSPITDAYLVDLSPRGSRERRSFFVSNTPLQAVVRNNGTSTLTSVTLNLSVDAAAPVSTVFPLSLPAGSDTTLNLAPITGSAGNHTLVIYTSSPNGVSDGYLNNDTLNSYINIIGANASLPFSEDFSSTTFPPAGWQIWNPNGGASNTWTRDPISGATNAGSAFFDNFDINQDGTLDELITPAIDPGTNTNVELDFKVAYAAVDAIDVSSWDGLEVYVSGDGGKTYNLVYKKTGNQLATAPVTTDSFTAKISEPGKWREETIILSPYVVAGQKLIVKFRNTNAFGNNIYLDDINIAAICPTCTRDLQVVSIDNPRGFECSANITPSATIKNKGIETITAFSIAYKIDSGAVQTTNVTGINLTKDQTMPVSMPISFNLPIGQHTITVYTFNPVSSLGTGDLFTSNDTLQKGFGISGTTNAPLSEGFESTTFPPAGWVVVNPDGNITWKRAAAGNSSGGSAFVDNYDYGFTGRVDDLVTPIVNYSGVDSVSLSFDVAAGLTIGSPTDTLEVLLTKDCGNTFTSLYKKWGTDLQTTASPQTNPFFPSSSPSQWRTERIDLTTIAVTGPTQIIFRNTNNNKNNIFIDNVNLKTRILPGRLKREGLLILPNPFVNQFTVWHYLPPTNLRAILVYNSVGQLVWSKQFNGDAQKQEVIDLSSRSPGMYVVHMVYTDSNLNTSVKIIKE